MEEYTIIVLDYCSGDVRVYHFDNEPEDPEQWLYSHDAAYNESTCNWMGTKGSFEYTEYEAKDMEELKDA